MKRSVTIACSLLVASAFSGGVALAESNPTKAEVQRMEKEIQELRSQVNGLKASVPPCPGMAGDRSGMRRGMAQGDAGMRGQMGQMRHGMGNMPSEGDEEPGTKDETSQGSESGSAPQHAGGNK